MHYISLCIKFNINSEKKQYHKLIAITKEQSKISEVQSDWDEIKNTEGIKWYDLDPRTIIKKIENFFIKYEVEDWSGIVSDLYRANSCSKVNIMETIEKSFTYSGKVTTL